MNYMDQALWVVCGVRNRRLWVKYEDHLQCRVRGDGIHVDLTDERNHMN